MAAWEKEARVSLREARLPETMYRGIPLLEIDAIVALGPVIPEDVTQARKMG